jgi:broad specificity phosphatase PhoE
VSARLTLVTHASTAATSRAAFAHDEGLEPRGAAAATGARRAGLLRRVTRAGCSPAPAAVETAAALGLSATPDPGLADWHLGAWQGRTLDEVAADTPSAVAAWLGDPDAAPHGGETLTALVARVAAWLARPGAEGHTVAVTHPAVVRAAVVATLGAPAAGFWRIDVAPLTATVLRGGPTRWTVRGTALPLDAGPGGGSGRSG